MRKRGDGAVALTRPTSSLRHWQEAVDTYVTPTRWRCPVFYHRLRAINYTNLHGRTYSPLSILNTSHILFFPNKIILDPFQGPPWLTTPFFEFPFSRYITSNLFPPLHLNSRFGEAADTYLQRHPYTNTYYVTTTSSTAFHKVSSLHYLLFFSK